MNTSVGCAILAAGASRRLGRPKQLVIHRGAPLVLRAAECALRSRAAAHAVVVGAEQSAVRAALAGAALEIVENADWREGVASSIRAAAKWAKSRRLRALIIALCDQPKLTSEHLDRLIAEYERLGLPVASFYAQKNAVPALIPSAYFGELSALSGDRGASAVLNSGTPIAAVTWPDGEFDVDDVEAERQLQAGN
ncbi:MAG TPA: nucleotidyltransferase family protein [Polyangiaceae bacterium]|nr:nucleotidyltransferase family protein [Polyangiaceae bacterium]